MEQGKRNQSGERRYISEEVLEEILVRLPVKSLLRFKCVSKTWRSQIQSRSFIDLYCRHPSRRGYSRFNVFSPYAACLKEFTTKLPSSALDTRLSPGPPDLLLPRKLMLLKRPYYDPEWRRVVRVLGPTPNGIYCLVANMHKESSRCVSIATGKIALCNPATHDYKFISPFPCDSHSLLSELAHKPCRIHYGFGCVPVGDQFHYKVIIIISWGLQFSSFLSFVYSLQDDKWRKIADYQHNSRDDSERKATQGLVIQQGKVQYPEITQDVELCPRTFFNGCWHWFAVQPDGTYSVLSFDFSDDAFKVMGAPGEGDYFDYLDDDDAYVDGGGILVLNDHLSAVCFTTPCCDIDVWMMMEYGVADSWTKIYAIQPGLLAHNFSRIVGLFFSSPSEILEILFVDDSHRLLCCHDLGAYGVGRYIDISEFIFWNTVGISAYMESLEPLTCPN